MKVLALVLLACLGIAAADEEPTTDLDQLAEEVRNAPFVDLDPEAADDDADDADVEIKDGKRIWNPFKKLFNKAKNNCGCPQGARCECCFGIPFIKARGCMGGRLIDGQFEVGLTINGKNFLSKRFPIRGRTEVCGALPPPLSTASFCFAEVNNPIAGGVAVCSGIDFRINGAVGAAMNFQCIDIRGGKLAVGGYVKVKEGGFLNFSVKNPFVAFAKFISKKLRTLDDEEQLPAIQTQPLTQ